MIPEIALFLRDLHQKGLYHRDLYTKHLLLSEKKWYLIDLQRLLQKEPGNVGLIAQDLSALYITTRRDKLGQKGQVLFLRYYLTGENRALKPEEKQQAKKIISGIGKRFQKMKSRKKFKKFLSPEA